MKHVTPESGAVYGDKGCCDKNAKAAVTKKLKDRVVCNSPYLD